MKKLITLTLAGVLALTPLSAFAFEPVTAYDDGTWKTTVDGLQVVKDIDGKDAVALILTFTNSDSEPDSAMSTMLFKAYQDGKQLETTYTDSDNEVEVEGDSYTDVFGGASVQFAEYYILESNSPELNFQADSFNEDGEMITLSLEDAGFEVETEQDYEQLYNDLLIKYNALLEKYGETE